MNINRFWIPTLLITVICLFAACRENDEPAFETSTEDLMAALVSTEWRVDLFFDGDNKTGQLAEFVFLFYDDGRVAATQSGTLQGTWNVRSHGRAESKLILEFDPSSELGLLTDEWRTVEISESFLRFEDVGGGPGEITRVNKLTLKSNQ